MTQNDQLDDCFSFIKDLKTEIQHLRGLNRQKDKYIKRLQQRLEVAEQARNLAATKIVPGPSVAINDVQVIQDSQQETTQVSSNNEVSCERNAERISDPGVSDRTDQDTTAAVTLKTEEIAEKRASAMEPSVCLNDVAVVILSDSSSEDDTEEEVNEMPSSSSSSKKGRQSSRNVAAASCANCCKSNKESSLSTKATNTKQSMRGKGEIGIHNRLGHAAGTITSYAGGYHIVWKGSKKGTDCLHDAQGHHYSYYVDPRCAKYKPPTEREAYWRCSGQHRVWTRTGLRQSKICGMLLHELDGIFTNETEKNHMSEPHSAKNYLKQCYACRLQNRRKR